MRLLLLGFSGCSKDNELEELTGKTGVAGNG